MLNIYVWENVRFIVTVFATLAAFSASWLYLDAWQNQKTAHAWLKFSGFLVLSLSFLTRSALTESFLPTARLLSFQPWLASASLLLAYLGYCLLIFGLILDRLPVRPQPASHLSLTQFLGASRLPLFLLPLAACGLYLYRVIRGLEKHLLPVAVSLGLLAVSELLAALAVWRSTPNIGLYRLLAAFGPVWIIQYLLLLLFSLVLLRWVFGYLLKRLFTQIFFILVCINLCVFIVTVVSFTYLLIGHIKSSTLAQTETSAKVLNLTLDSRLEQLLADTRVLAQDASLTGLLTSPAPSSLTSLVKDWLLSKGYRSLTVTDAQGAVLTRAHDSQLTNDSLSVSPLIQAAISGTAGSGLTIDNSAGPSPTLSLTAWVPVIAQEKVIAILLTTSSLDAIFVHNLEQTTGLTASVYTHNQLSASTLATSPLVESHPAILDTVLKLGQIYSGPNTLGSTPYLSTFLPLKDFTNVPIGMLAVGRPESVALVSAGSAVETTFVITALLILISLVPAYFISGYLSRQLT